MFKKLLPLFLLLAGFTTITYAQPTLTGANINPAMGDTFLTIVCDTTGVTQGASGASKTWDFSGLMTTTVTPTSNIGAVVPPVTTTAYAYLYTFVPGISAATTAILDPVSLATTFSIANATKLSSNGVYINADNNAVYTDPQDQLHFPFTYGNTFTDTYAGFIHFTPTGSPTILAGESGTVTVTADAYGKLILPPVPPAIANKEYDNVLRVYSQQAFRDSADIFGTPVVETYAIESYTWYQPGYHSALLTISTVSGPGLTNKIVSYAQRQLANHEAVPALSNIEGSLKLYPNPAQGELNIEYKAINSDPVRISLCDVTGREVALIAENCTSGFQKTSYATGSLSKGLYLIRLESGGQSISRKVEVQ